MTGDNKNIDKLFRDHLSGLKEKTPVHSWSRIDHALNKSIFQKKLFYYRLAAASLLIFLAFGAGYYYALYLTRSADFADQELPEINVPANAEEEMLNAEIPSTNDIQQGLIKPEQTTDIRTGNDNSSNSKTTPDNKKNRNTSTPLIHQSTTLASNETYVSEIQTRDQRGINTIAFLDIKKLDLEKQIDENLNTGHQDTYQADLFLGYGDILPYELDYEPEKTKSQWALGAQFAPTYSYREISTNYGSNPVTAGQQQDNYNNVEDALLSYAGGLNVDYNFSGNWSFQSGMYYSRIGQVNNDALQFQEKNNELILSAINTSTGNINVAIERVPDNVKKITSPKDTIDISSISNVKIVQNFDLFEIPFLLRYKVLNRKFSILFSGGLSPAYLVDNNTYLEMEDHKYDIGNSNNLNSMIVNTSLGLGLEYLITKQLSVNFEPTFKYSLNPINNSSNFSYHPYYFSLFTGIRLKIN